MPSIAFTCVSAPVGKGKLRRSLFGYRRSDVDALLEQRTAELIDCRAAGAELAAEAKAARAREGELEVVCDLLSERVVRTEQRLAALRAELVSLQGRDDRGTEALIGLSDELDGLRRQARGQATRIRLRALQDAVEISERIAELARRPAEARERLLEGLNEAIARLGESTGDEEPETGAGGAALRSADELFEGTVEVEVGPLGDFSQLVGFEDAAAAIGATSEISVRRFAGGRATLELKLAEPVELLSELEQRAPFGFAVRERRFDRIVLDVDAEAAEAA